MAIHRKRSSSRRTRRSRSRSRKMRGGTYSSASTYNEYVNGPMNAQFDRTMSQPGQSNALIGAQGQSVGTLQHMPTGSQLALVQKAGKKGGFLGQVINQAIVPLGILGMQQSYKRKKGGRKRTHKHRRH